MKNHKERMAEIGIDLDDKTDRIIYEQIEEEMTQTDWMRLAVAAIEQAMPVEHYNSWLSGAAAQVEAIIAEIEAEE